MTKGLIKARLKTLGIILPDAPPPAANYVPFVISQSLVFISGQLPMEKGALTYKGHCGDDVSLEQGQAAARLCAINILAQLNAALKGDLDRVRRCVRLGGFVSCADSFIDQPKVVNGASDLIADVFGPAGRHARAAVGVNSLPLGAAVEVEALFEIRPQT